MADITARLVWYKLTEKYSDVCEKYERFLDWYEDFSWSRVDFLDMLFLGWLLAAFVVVGAINLYLRFFAHPRSKGGLKGGGVSPLHGESVEWLNKLLSWLFTHYSHTPDLVDAWLAAVNEQLKKQSEYQIKVDSIQTGSPPPQLSHISTDTSTKDCMVVHCGVETRADTGLLVSAIQQNPTNIRVTNCDVAILKLKGQLKLQSVLKPAQNLIDISLCFAASPELSLQVRPRQIDSRVKVKLVEDALRSSISSSVTSVTLPSTGGYPNFYPGLLLATPSSETSLIQKRTPVTTTRSTAQDFTAAVKAASPGGTLKHRKLLVKVIKANGLGDKDFGCSGSFCTVTAEDPPQNHVTSVVKNTVNPFWDEHFVFDLNDQTKNIKFEVFEGEKIAAGTPDFLGRAVIPMQELKRLPSSRQIIPLTGKPGTTTTSGSVTVEFLFMESPESGQPFGSVNKSDMDGISPRRRIETSRTVTPGGTHVTMTTTTTERPRENTEPAYNDLHQASPSRIEKSDTSSSYTAEYSPYSSSSRSSHLGAHEAGLTASQQAPAMSSPLGSPSLTLTPSGGRVEHHLTPDQHQELGRDSRNQVPGTAENRATQEVVDPDEVKKSKSFASTLKRRFQRGDKKSKRSQSADRASSMRESSLLRPPGQEGGRMSDDTSQTDIPEAGLQKNRQRSRSFSSSLKKLFKGKKKEGGVSRESSVSRQSTRSAQGALSLSREGGSAQHSPQVQRQSSPDASSHDFPYSSSLPTGPSPLYDQYSVH